MKCIHILSCNAGYIMVFICNDSFIRLNNELNPREFKNWNIPALPSQNGFKESLKFTALQRKE